MFFHLTPELQSIAHMGECSDNAVSRDTRSIATPGINREVL